MRRKHRKFRGWIDGINVSGQPQPRQIRDTAVVMHVWNEYFDAKAEWRRRANVWACTRADKVIRWMVGMNRDKAKVELLKRGCNWEHLKL